MKKTITIAIAVEPRQVELANFVLDRAAKWVRQNQPNYHELLPTDADNLEAFRLKMLDSFLQKTEERTCRICGCTDEDCSQCIEKTGTPCHWVEHDLCSTCAAPIAESPAGDGPCMCEKCGAVISHQEWETLGGICDDCACESA